MRRPSLLILLFVPWAFASANTPPLLGKAVGKWLGERDNWAFTVLVKEYDGGLLKEERSERYDPSIPGIGRWQLLSIDGRPPTGEQRAEWQKRKTRKRKAPVKRLSDYLEFESARIVKADARTVCYHVPLRSNNGWLFPVDKVDLKITVNRSTQAIEEVVAGIDEPFKVALGFARVLNVDFDMQMNPPERPPETAANPSEAKPDGKATVVVRKLGRRIKYAWSGFKRVTPVPDNVVAGASD